MNFSVLPPEVNSARMFVGAGSGPMLAAAAAWHGLAGELSSAADSFGSLTSGLADGPWQGAASAAMTSVAARYVGFLNTAATHADGAAAQANASAAAFEAAQAAIVHPAVVSANRTQLVSLVTSNLFGQNAPAIAATEAHYEQMWAQDVAAMVGYHADASAAATQLGPGLQALNRGATRLAGLLGLNPVVTPVPSNPGLMSQTLNIGKLSLTSYADLDRNFDAAIFSTPGFTGSFTSGSEPVLGLGATGQTVISLRSSVLPALDSQIAVPVTDPLTKLFAALLPLNF
jgi:PPE-repeat protein